MIINMYHEEADNATGTQKEHITLTYLQFTKTEPLGGKLSLPSCCSHQSTFKMNLQRKEKLESKSALHRNSVYSNVCCRANPMFIGQLTLSEKRHTLKPQNNHSAIGNDSFHVNAAFGKLLKITD